MFNQFFGHFLLSENLVKKEDLQSALEIIDTVHLKIGVRAVNSGFMKVEEIEKVHSKQAAVDRRFGELAIEMGYLTEGQLEIILSTEKKEHLMLGQALIDKGFMSLDDFEDSLNKYKEKNKLSDEQFEALKNNDVESIVGTFLKFDEGDSSFYRNYITLVINNIVRFITRSVRIEKAERITEYTHEWIINQEIAGSKNLSTVMAMDEATFIKFGSIYAEIEVNKADELIQDSVAEFINLHNGLFLVNASNDGIEMQMEPQLIKQSTKLVYKKITYLVPVYLDFGRVDFILSERAPIIKS